VQAWIEAERAARPLWTALSTLVQQESWDDSRRAAWADPQLHDHAALVGLEELARIASVRGDDELAEVYLVHRARLAHWQATDFAPEKVTVATSQTASVGLLLQELTMLADQHHASSARRRIELAHAILDQVSRSDESQVWGVVQRMLGDAHWAFYEQSGSVEEADLAEAAYKAALEIITREASPTAWASVQATLGNLREHRYNMTGEEHWADAADSAYRAALEVRTLDAERDDWIRTQSDRAHLLSSRYENTSDYRWGELADAAFRSIFPVVDKEVNPVTWASTQRRWADLQQSRYAHGSEEHLAQVAESAYRSAIEVYAPELYPESWAGTQLNLGNLLSTRYRRTNDERWAGAAEMAYRSALQVFTRSTESGDWAKVQHNMAGLLAFRFEATREARFADDAEAAYRAALEIYDPQAVPAFAISPQRGLARLLMLRERWVEAAAAFEVALQTVERQYLTAPGDAERRQIMADNAHLYQSHAYCLLRQGNPLGALARLEEGWARSLTEQFALEETAYARYGVDGLERLQARRRALRAAEARLDAVTAQLLVTTSNWEQNTLAETRNASVAEVRSAYDKLRAEIRALQLEPALLTPAGLQTLQLPHETAAVALLLGTDGHALVLYKGTVSSVPLPQFGEDYLYELVHDHSQISEWTDIFPPGFTDALRASLDAKEADGDTSATNATLNVALDEARGHMQAILDSLAASRGNYQAGWYQSYNLTFYLLHELGGKRHPQAQQAAYDGWKATVVRTLDSLYKHFWTPIVRALPTDVHHILLLVGGDAALMPFHAAAPSSLTVAYVPSLGVWQHSDLAAKGRTSDALLLATPAPLEDLAFTAVEGEWLMDRFSGQGPGRSLRLDQAEATVAKVLHAAHGRGIVHFSGHARYEWLDPLSSGLVCSDGILTVAHARHQWDLSTTRLVTLSACESGIADVFRSGGEWVGLPASLVEAGAPAVVASLWPVNDMSTAFLMDRFYALWREPGAGRTIAGALREAALWMRNASWAELGARLAQSNLTPERRGLLATLLGKLQTPTRNRQPDIVGDFIERLAVADPDERPFAAPYYWAAFAAYGAVL
jgi:CHAT domain-containing protein